MKKVLTLISLAVLIFSCTSDNNFKVQGVVENVNLDGQTIYLVSYIGEEQLYSDTTVVKNNKFQFEGIIDKPMIFFAFMDYVDSYNGDIAVGVPFLVKQGKTTLRIDGDYAIIGGNEENDTYQAVQDIRADVIRQLTDLSTGLDLDDDSEEAMQALEAIEPEVNAIYSRYSSALTDYLVRHINTELGEEIFRLNIQILTPEEIETVLNAANETVRSQQDIQELIYTLEALKKKEAEERNQEEKK